MNPKLKSILKIVLPLGFGVSLIYLFYRQLSAADLKDMKAAVTSANYWWLLLSVSFTLISQSIRGLRWQALLKATGNEVPFLRAFNAISVNYFVNIGIPRAGEIARCGVLATYNGIPVNKSIGTVVNERIIDVLMLLFAGVLAFIFQYQIFIDFYNVHLAIFIEPLAQWFLLRPLISLTLVALAIIIGVLILNSLLKTKSKPESKFGKIMQGFKDGILSIFNLEKPWYFVLQTILIWICYFFMVLFAFKTISQGNMLGFGAALSLLFFGTFGFIATPGGIGAYPIIVGYLLSLYGLEIHLGTTLGWILWLGQTILIIVFGIIAFVMLAREKNINQQIPTSATKDS